MVLIEEWRLIHNDYYEVSNLGNVRRSKPGIATFVGRPVQPVKGSTGYPMVALGGPNPRRVYVHQIVAEAFLGPRPDKHVINHKDCDTLNNAATNLEYVTRAENATHAARNVVRRKGPTKPKKPLVGLPRGDNHWTRKSPEKIARGFAMPHCKLSPEQVVQARVRVAAGEMQRDLAAELQISIAQMSRIIRGKRWTYL